MTLKKYKRKTKKKRKKRNIKYKFPRTRKRKIRRKQKGGNGIKTVSELVNKLEHYNINMTTWNAENKNKSVDQLFKEIKNGDSIIHEDGGEIYRTVLVANALILSDDNKYKLIEKAHLDINKNIVKERNNEVLSEKMDSSETVSGAIIRGVKEELGEKYVSSVAFLDGESKEGIKHVEKDSYSYPGLKSRYSFYQKTIKIPLLTQDFPPPSEFVTEDKNSDGSFKRYIMWKWKLNN
jgi:hypothetical protein